MLVRIIFGHLPDRIGSIPVAMVSLAVEAVGQYLLWIAPSPDLALTGAFLANRSQAVGPDGMTECARKRPSSPGEPSKSRENPGQFNICSRS